MVLEACALVLGVSSLQHLVTPCATQLSPARLTALLRRCARATLLPLVQVHKKILDFGVLTDCGKLKIHGSEIPAWALGAGLH